MAVTEAMDQAAERVRRMARALGFALAGVAPAAPSAHADFVRRWIAEGRHGEMQYLAEHLDVRLDPRRLLPGAKSVICVADLYAASGGETTAAEAAEPGDMPGARGRVARYAWGDDYHKVIKRRLFALADALRERWPDAAFRCVVDTAPALEREHATRAGLGWVGKHTLLLHPQLGSWMLLGLIVTTLDLPSSAEQGFPDRLTPPTDHCGTCTRCIDACPTGCIEDPAHTGRRALDASRCISYLTLEHRSLIPPDLHEPMGDWLAGCDVCQEVCPYNAHPERVAAADVQVHPRYTPRPELARGLPPLEVLGWSAEDRQEAFRGSALKRVKLDMLKRNALIAAGNALGRGDDPALRQRIEQIAEDAAEPDLVRETARQVLARLAPP